MIENTHHPILDEVLAHCAERGLSKSKFGDMAIGDPNFVFDLESGRDPRRQTVNRVRSFMATDATPIQIPEAVLSADR